MNEIIDLIENFTNENFYHFKRNFNIKQKFSFTSQKINRCCEIAKQTSKTNNIVNDTRVLKIDIN